MKTAVPPTAVARLPKVPSRIALCRVSVNDSYVVQMYAEFIRRDLRERSSCPCPCGDAPVNVTLPVGSMRTVALSQPPAGMACDGPSAQIST